MGSTPVPRMYIHLLQRGRGALALALADSSKETIRICWTRVHITVRHARVLLVCPPGTRLALALALTFDIFCWVPFLGRLQTKVGPTVGPEGGGPGLHFQTFRSCGLSVCTCVHYDYGRFRLSRAAVKDFDAGPTVSQLMQNSMTLRRYILDL